MLGAHLHRFNFSVGANVNGIVICGLSAIAIAVLVLRKCFEHATAHRLLSFDVVIRDSMADANSF